MGLDFLLQPLFGIHFWPVKDRMCRPNKCSYKNNNVMAVICLMFYLSWAAEILWRLNFPAAKNKERKENIMPRYVFAFTAAVLFSIGIIFGPVSFCFGVFCVGPKIKAAVIIIFGH